MNTMHNEAVPQAVAGQQNEDVSKMNWISKEIARLSRATGYSMQGFRHAWEGEAAFRFEVILASLMLPAAILLDVGALERIALVGTVVLVLIVELLNSAVEAAIDRVGSELHPLSARAKDLGSAAVFVALLLAVFTWATVLLDRFIYQAN